MGKHTDPVDNIGVAFLMLTFRVEPLSQVTLKLFERWWVVFIPPKFGAFVLGEKGEFNFLGPALVSSSCPLP